MQLTKRQLKSLVETAYSIGYDDCANQSGYDIAVREMGLKTRIHKRPKCVSKPELLKRAITAAIRGEE